MSGFLAARWADVLRGDLGRPVPAGGGRGTAALSTYEKECGKVKHTALAADQPPARPMHSSTSNLGEVSTPFSLLFLTTGGRYETGLLGFDLFRVTDPGFGRPSTPPRAGKPRLPPGNPGHPGSPGSSKASADLTAVQRGQECINNGDARRRALSLVLKWEVPWTGARR
ncbi:hypothetical protein Bbelb_057820 [Branchiostoma belcheri]|nr:hypothetical protein Bbelb_057820 [Branchiostoma belcheri]